MSSRKSTEVRTAKKVDSDVDDASRLVTERSELAAQQELLLSALVEHGKIPESIDLQQIEATANSLFRKRTRSISRSHPELASDQADYLQNMKEYAAIYPGSHPDGICSDATRFKTFVTSKRPKSKLDIIALLKRRTSHLLQTLHHIATTITRCRHHP